MGVVLAEVGACVGVVGVGVVGDVVCEGVRVGGEGAAG